MARCSQPLRAGFSHAETAGWTAALTLGSLVGGVVLLAGFVVAERRVRHPLLPLRVIVDRARGGAYVAVGISGMALFGTFLFLTFYLQVVKGNSPLTTGLLFLPMIGSILISSNLSSNIGLGPRALIAAGMLLGAGGLVLLTQVTVTSSYVSDVLPGLLILGLGFGLIFAQAINTATAGVAREDAGAASALVNTTQQVGGSIGTSALSTIALSATATYLIGHDTSPLAPAIAATHGYTFAFGYRRGCSDSASSSRLCCCRLGAGWPTLGTRVPRPRPHPARPQRPPLLLSRRLAKRFPSPCAVVRP